MKFSYFNHIFNFLLIAFFNSIWLIDSQVCQNYPYKPGPGSNPSLPNKYSVRVEVNMLEDDKTYEMRAYYDNQKRKAALEIKDNNLIKKLIFNYETDEIYLLESVPIVPISITLPPDYQPLYPTTCKTYTLSTNLTLNYYFGFTGSSANLFPGPASQFFRFTPQAYDGNETVRGIPCDVYISCQYNPATLANYTIRHFFSKSNFLLVSSNQSFSRLPIRATYYGSALKPDGSNKEFKNVFEYYDFRLNIERDDVFQTPGGVFCENRKLTNKKPPEIKGSFRFSEEITSKGTTSHIKDLVYDEELQIIKYETRNLYKNESDVFAKDPFLYINDYSIGVSYKTNINSGKCNIETIDSFAFAADKNFTQAMLDSGNGYSIRLKTPSSLLELDANYTYVGQRIIDGIPSDLFISKVDISKNISTINEYAFTSNYLNISNNQKLENNIPKRLAKASKQALFDSVSTIYNFEITESNINEFDVSNCYDKNSLIEFKLILKPKSDVDLLILKKIDINKNLRKPIYLTFTKLTGEQSIRFSIPRFTLSEDGTLIVRSAVLPGPSPLNLFTRFPSKLLTNTQFSFITNISNNLGCAVKCLERNNCLSFDYNNKTKGCYLNTKHFTTGSFTNYFTDYDHYSRNSLKSVKFSEKFVVWNDLQNNFNSKISLTIPVYTIEQNFTLAINAQSIEEVTITENRFGTTSNLLRYNLKKPNFKFNSNKDQLLNKINIDDCAKKCTDEIGIQCKSFHYCFLSGECVISKDFLPNDNQSYIPSDNCDIYEKDALIHYNLFLTKASINPKDKKYTMIDSASGCAEKCDNEQKINCKSFNFCPNINECYLSETHLLDGSQSDSSNNLICNHYSRKYIEDFTYINTAEIKLSAEVVLKESNLDICSTACVNSDGINCKSFDFCPETKTCLLNSDQKQIQQSSASDITTDFCAHYRREYFFITSQSNSKTKDNSQGTLTALTIIFALVASGLGGLGSVFLIKKFGNRK